MSIQALTYVLEHCDAKYGPRNLMFAIANHANERGENCWASVATLGHEARLSRRATQEALAKLIADGEIEQTGVSAANTRIYRIVAMAERVDQLPLLAHRSGGADPAPPRSGDADGVREGAQILRGGARNAAPSTTKSAPEPSGTETTTTTPPTPQRGEPVFPEMKGTRRQRDNAKVDALITAWAAQHMPDLHPRTVANAAFRARARGLEPTPSVIRENLTAIERELAA